MAAKVFPDCPLSRDLTWGLGCQWQRVDILDVKKDGSQQRSLYRCNSCGTHKEKVEKGGT